MNNLYENIKYSLDEELIDLIYKSKIVEITRIASSNQTTDWMSDDRLEIAILLEGEAIIEFIDTKKTMKKGDMIKINPLTSHRVINTSPTGLWLAIYLVI